MSDPATDSELRAAALERVLDAVLPGPVQVTEVRRLAGGASADLAAVTAVDGAGTAHALVLRCADGDQAAGLRAGIPAETAALRAAAAAGAPVPEVLTSFAAEPPLGKGYLMARLDGEALPGRLLRGAEFAGLRGRLLGDAACALARIHAAPAGGLGLARLGARDQVDALAGLHRSFGQPVPTFELALRWLTEHLPVDQAADDVLVHGDFRMGNLLCDEAGLVGVLDWELAHLGDPDEDLGWFCAPAWRFGGPGPAGGLGSREELLASYAAESGRRVDPGRLRFWEVLATLKWGVICQFQAARVLGGGSGGGGEVSVEHALIGRRLSEVALDLLLLLVDPDDLAAVAPLPDPEPGLEDVPAVRADRPSVEDLLQVTAAQLDADLLPTLEGRPRFLARVALNALGVARREVVLGPAATRLQVASARASGLPASDEALAAAIRDGEVDPGSAVLRAHLVRCAAARLEIDSPSYPALADAGERWPFLPRPAGPR